MIQSFGDRETKKVFEEEFSRKLPVDIQDRAHIKLVLIHRAESLDDLREPPSHHLEALKGDLEGFHSIRINKQWRIIFRWEGSSAHDVEIVDYH